MAVKLPVLRLAFLTSPLHYAHILPEPHSLCSKAYLSNSGGSSEHPTGRLKSVECWASKTEIKKTQESFWMAVGLCPKKRKTWAFQEHWSLSECFLCYVLAEVFPPVPCEDQFPILFPACMSVLCRKSWLPYICVSILYWCFSFWLTSLCIIGSSFIHLIRTYSNVFFLMAE